MWSSPPAAAKICQNRVKFYTRHKKGGEGILWNSRTFTGVFLNEKKPQGVGMRKHFLEKQASNIKFRVSFFCANVLLEYVLRHLVLAIKAGNFSRRLLREMWEKGR